MMDAMDCEYSIDGEGPPLILIHGIGAARDTWRFALPVLKNHFTVVTYDLRGHGASPVPSTTFGMDELVNDLERVRERAGIEQAHFAGHSLGGMIGPAYARQYPQRVLSLGLLSTAAFRTPDDSKKVLGVVEAMERDGIPDILSTLTNRWFTDRFLDNHPDIVDRRLDQVIATNPDVFLNVFRIYATFEMSSWLHEISHPSLVLTGENDGGCPPRLNKVIVQAMQNAELVVLPEYKHSLLLEAGEDVARQLVRFVKSLS
ncbi:MAG: alpha/beta hydrolase [Pseudomonadota bacterium]